MMFFAILAFLFPSSVLHQMVIQVFLFQVLHFYCDTCSVPICRECTMGRHVGHSFIYLQDALQDSRTLTIQLLADAQQGRQAIQVRYSQLKCLTFFFYPSQLVWYRAECQAKSSLMLLSAFSPLLFSQIWQKWLYGWKRSAVMNFAFLQHSPVMQIIIYMKLCPNALEHEAFWVKFWSGTEVPSMLLFLQLRLLFSDVFYVCIASTL